MREIMLAVLALGINTDRGLETSPIIHEIDARMVAFLGAKLAQFSTREFEGDVIMALDEHWEINIEQLSMLDAHTPVDDAQIHLWWITEEE